MQTWDIVIMAQVVGLLPQPLFGEWTSGWDLSLAVCLFLSLCLSNLKRGGIFGEVVKPLLGLPTSHVECLGSSPGSLPNSLCQLMYTLGSRRWYFKWLVFHHPSGRSRLSSWLLVLAWPSPRCCGHLSSEPVDERSLSCSHSAFQIKFFKIKIKSRRLGYVVTLLTSSSVLSSQPSLLP